MRLKKVLDGAHVISLLAFALFHLSSLS